MLQWQGPQEADDVTSNDDFKSFYFIFINVVFMVNNEQSCDHITENQRGQHYYLTLLCRACLHSFFIGYQSARELRITSISRDAAI